MSAVNIAQPDVTLFLDLSGVIHRASVSDSILEPDVDAWLGQSWADTVQAVGGGDKVKRILEDARTRGVSGFRQVTQRFPSGLELPIEYTAVRLGGKGGLLAIGRNLQAVADLQSRLVAAQQAMERDYWKLREVETRYRLLFDASNEAVILLRANNLRIVEANFAAIRALGLAPQRPESVAGHDFLQQIAPRDRRSVQAMLNRVGEQGKAPGILIHVGEAAEAWLVRASLTTSAAGPVFLLQLSPAGTQSVPVEINRSELIDDLVERIPDGFVVLDRTGTIVRANRAFLDLVQSGAEASVIGEKLGRWLSRPGADLAVLLANVQKHQSVRLFSTTVQGELGTDTEVEISAAGNSEGNPEHVGVLIRDVGRRLASPHDDGRLRSVLAPMSDRVGKTPLRKLVKEAVGTLERHYIRAALELAGGNRTVAAELLGLSRQSLYEKLDRYDLDGSPLRPSSGS